MQLYITLNLHNNFQQVWSSNHFRETIMKHNNGITEGSSILFHNGFLENVLRIEKCCKLRSAIFWDITQHIVVIPYWCSGATIFKGQESQDDFLTLEDGANRLCNTPEKCRPHLFHGRGLTLCMLETVMEIMRDIQSHVHTVTVLFWINYKT